MTLRLRAFAAIPPPLLRPLVVRRLLRATAGAFRAPPPRVGGVSGRALLRAYARFSDARARSLLEGDGDLDAARRDLWGSAQRLGGMLRRRLGVRTVADAMVAARAVYRALDIDLRGSAGGDVLVGRCSFARLYTPEVCAVMASVDAGVFAGLTGGRRLTFRRRITEGAPACVARLEEPAA